MAEKARTGVTKEDLRPFVKEMASEIKLELPIPPSVNNAYTINRYTRQIVPKETVKRWIESAAWIATDEKRKQRWCFSRNEKLILELTAFWKDNSRDRDIHNLHKPLADALEGVLYENDCMVLIRDMDFSVDSKNPRIEVVVRRA